MIIPYVLNSVGDISCLPFVSLIDYMGLNLGLAHIVTKCHDAPPY